jgi:nicotinamidase-related amidase
MATIRTGNKAALLVVDAQTGVLASVWERDHIVGAIAHVVSRARGASVPVVWVQHSDDDLERGSEAWEWAPELDPRPDEIAVHKTFNSAFEQTDLDAVLERLGVSHIVLAGAATNWCIRATAYAALDRGYDLTLVKDAHTTELMEFADGRRIEAQDIIDDLNIVMRWLSYPGRLNGASAAAEVDFHAPGGSR